MPLALGHVKAGSHSSGSLQEQNPAVGVSSREDAHLLQTSAFPSRHRFLGESLPLGAAAIRKHEAVPLGSYRPAGELVWRRGLKVWI